MKCITTKESCVQENTIFRLSLIEKIAPPGSKLTYIHADAGYGKTTLLAQYAKGLNDVVWISLDDKDRDEVYFLRHLEKCIRNNLHKFDFYSTDYIPFVHDKSFIPTVLSGLLEAIGTRELTIIIDDVHIVDNERVTDLFIQWVKNCPQNITLIMASRHELWSGLFRLKIEGRIVELTKKDLSFSREETEKLWGFFDQDAYSATEGWILAIQSYRIAAEGNRKLSRSTLYTNRELFRYLMNEMFMSLPAEMQHFLKATSYLPVLDVHICNSLLGINNSQKILEELLRRNIFTLHISQFTYRYHTLFSYFLQKIDDSLGRITLGKAMTLSYEGGDFQEAADYALLLGDEGMIKDCISGLLDKPFEGGRLRSFKKYFDFLQPISVGLPPRVLLARGMYLSEQGEFSEAEKFLRGAIPHLDSEDKHLYLHAMVHQARVLRNRVSFQESTNCIDNLLPLSEDTPMQLQYMVMIEKIHNLTLTSQLSAALDLTLNMMEKSLVAGNAGVKLWLERYLTAIYFYMGDYKNCLKVYEKTLTISKEEQDWLMRHSVGAYAAKAYQVSGQEEKVQPLLQEELARMHQLGLYEELSLIYIIHSDILHAEELLKLYLGKRADFSEANRYLAMAEEYAVLNRSTRDHALLAKIWKLCAGLLQQPDKARENIEKSLALVEDTTPFTQSLTYGRIANALDTLGQSPQECREYFKRSIKIGEDIGSYTYATPSYGRLAAIYLKEGDKEKAVEYTHSFLKLSRQYDYRYYLRFKPLFEPVLKLAAEEGITPEFTREILVYGGYTAKRVYINTFGRFYISSPHERENAVKIRTKKSRELLAYLLEHREGVTKEQICADLWRDSEANVTSLFHTRRGEIRRAFESLGAGNPILYEKGLYRLNMEEIIWDYDVFQQATDEFKKQPTLEKAQAVVDGYTGRYLDDMEALWSESTRLRCEDNFLEAAEIFLENYRALGQREKTMELLRRCKSLSYHSHSYPMAKERQDKK
ncbi:ATP-, maltotriose-and DNA-dependent transcriptional regulator MalT [Natronincola peptidivorans]|uniref:ATP-, maltotriose-and DNA-dependent transcriptional regulator MalT n=1 Tax=Natronincola peptidivorans TaxID=426128 RepID=A0A1I0DRI5_9FIRM|nr:hypothetical protein [Natronincola peptidivorans]SET34793.1 ATP-, maltotriose-and DNA-dependent transcriptional regulator MalT [Natronincola peptidivorans]